MWDSMSWHQNEEPDLTEFDKHEIEVVFLHSESPLVKTLMEMGTSFAAETSFYRL